MNERHNTKEEIQAEGALSLILAQFAKDAAKEYLDSQETVVVQLQESVPRLMAIDDFVVWLNPKGRENGVTRRTVEGWIYDIENKAIQTFKIGRKVFINIEHLLNVARGGIT